MKRKALLCALLALILLVPAQPAAALTSNQRETVIEAMARLPIIEVIVPSSADIMINPFEMPVWVGAFETDQQIICYPDYIISYSEVPVRVDVEVTGSVFPDSDLSLANSPTNGGGTAKRAFAYFEMQQSDASYWEGVRWDPSYNSSKHIVVAETARTKKGMVTLPALPLDYYMDGLLAENAYAWFRVAGDVAKSPTNPWTESDGISVRVVYTFTPLHYSSNP